MLLDGDDDLGFNPFGAVKKGVGAALRVASKPAAVVLAPSALGNKLLISAIASKMTGNAAAAAGSPTAPPPAPSCGIFQKISRLFGGRPDCV